MRSRLQRVHKNSNRRLILTVFLVFTGVPALFSLTPKHTVLSSVEVKSSYSVGVSPTPSLPPRIEIIEKPKVVMAIEDVGVTESTDIEKEIKEVFGKYSDKAFLLLKGNGQPGSCHENGSLNPKAKNDNTKWGGVGIDYGIFQINDHWQGFRHAGKAVQFLEDPHINIRVAWRIFEDDGYSFRQWTCGKKYGI